ncbi:MAG: cofactor-independent phosphoglycerate mutase [Cellulosilyticaceae bacterium]
MKYVVILVDGMADEAIDELGGVTPLAYAHTPTIDALAPFSQMGRVLTIPKGCAKGSDTANLSVLGYDPVRYSFGRSPLEALSMRVPLKASDVTFRANLVTLGEAENYDDQIMLDHSADEITTEEARELMAVVADALGDEVRTFYPGVSYRHLLVWDGGSVDVTLTPPHDILGKCIGDYKPSGKNACILWGLMKESYEKLNHHPINEARRQRGLRPANSIWIWGEGTKPTLPSFEEKYGVEGAVISAVDLIKGIGLGAGMQSLDVAGVTGNVHTNYKGKADRAIAWLIDEDKDFVYVHLEGPDEAGHRGELDHKIEAMSRIDDEIIHPIKEALEAKGLAYKLMVLPDHPTPLRLRTHTDEPVPYMIYHSENPKIYHEYGKYTEAYVQKISDFVESGHNLMDILIKKG